MSEHERLFVLTITEMKHFIPPDRILYQLYTHVGCCGCLVYLLTQTCVCYINIMTSSQNFASAYISISFI